MRCVLPRQGRVPRHGPGPRPVRGRVLMPTAGSSAPATFCRSRAPGAIWLDVEDPPPSQFVFKVRPAWRSATWAGCSALPGAVTRGTCSRPAGPSRRSSTHRGLSSTNSSGRNGSNASGNSRAALRIPHRRPFEHYARVDELFAGSSGSGPGGSIPPNWPCSNLLKPGMAGGYLHETDAHLRPDRLMAEPSASWWSTAWRFASSATGTGFAREHGIARPCGQRRVISRPSTSSSRPGRGAVPERGTRVPRPLPGKGTRSPCRGRSCVRPIR